MFQTQWFTEGYLPKDGLNLGSWHKYSLSWCYAHNIFQLFNPALPKSWASRSSWFLLSAWQFHISRLFPPLSRCNALIRRFMLSLWQYCSAIWVWFKSSRLFIDVFTRSGFDYIYIWWAISFGYVVFGWVCRYLRLLVAYLGRQYGMAIHRIQILHFCHISVPRSVVM